MNKKKNIIVISVVVILLVIAVVLFLLFGQNKTDKSIDVNINSENIETNKDRDSGKKSKEKKCLDGAKAYNGKCYKITEETRVEATKKCGTRMINKGNGKSEEVSGTIMYAGHNFCVYGEVSGEESHQICVIRKHYWFNGKCYYAHDNNYTITCPDKYTYFSDLNRIFGIDDIKINEGCFPYIE